MAPPRPRTHWWPVILATSIRIGGVEDVICGDVVGRRLCHEGVQDILREAGREMSRYVVGIVRVGAMFATCHSDAGFGSRAEKILGKVKV